MALCTRELGGQGQIEKVGLNPIRNGVRDGMWGARRKNLTAK